MTTSPCAVSRTILSSLDQTLNRRGSNSDERLRTGAVGIIRAHWSSRLVGTHRGGWWQGLWADRVRWSDEQRHRRHRLLALSLAVIATAAVVVQAYFQRR